MTIKLDAKDFSGVFVAMNSCYDAQGRLSPDAAGQLTRFLISKGVQGVYVGGGTGEGVLQSVEERKLMLEAVVRENRGLIKVIAHVGAITTEDSIALAKHAEQMGVDAISAIPPFYYAYSDRAVRDYWASIMNSTELPFIIYYIPSSTGFTMSLSLLREMLTHDKLCGIKITTFSTYELQQFKALGGDRFIVFNGPDQQFLAGRAMGADAGIGSTYGMMPELYLRIEEAFVQGDMTSARQWQFAVNEIISQARELGLFGTIKEMIRLRGIDCGHPRPPLARVDPANMQDVLNLHDKIMRYIQSDKVLQR